MFHLTVALLWGAIYFALLAYRPLAPAERAAYVETGAWAALVLLGYNLVRAVLGFVLRRRRAQVIDLPEQPPGPKPVVRPDFDFGDYPPPQRSE